MKKSVVLSLLVLLFLATAVSALTPQTAKPLIPVYGCQTLDREGASYVLQKDLDISDIDPCFWIKANKITFDMNKHALGGKGENVAIKVEEGYNYTTIKNGKLAHLDNGILLNDNKGLIIEGMDISFASRAISAAGIRDSIFRNNNITNVGQAGFFVFSVKNSTFSNNTLLNNAGGWDCTFCLNNKLLNNKIQYNSQGIFLNSNSHGNKIKGNDISYNGDGIILTSGASNNFIEDNVIHKNLGGVDNVGIGLYSDSSFNYIAGNTISSEDRGIWIFWQNTNNTVENNTFTSNKVPFLVHDSLNSVFAHNKVYGNDFSIGLGSGALNNLVYDNYFNNIEDFYYGFATPNTWNIEKTPGKNVIGGSFLGGNYWAKPDGSGYSETCADVDNDEFCDKQYAISEGNIDYLPITF